MRRIIILIAVIMATASDAAIYVNQGSNGSVEYSDTPTGNAKEVVVTPLNTVTPVATPATTQTTGNAATATPATAAISTSATYQTFTITSPVNGDTIQNQPVIPVSMNIEPTMMPGDKIQLYLDGKATGTPTSTIYQELGIVERGTHSLYAEIINTNNQAIKKSNSVTFEVHRNSLITSPATPRPAN